MNYILNNQDRFWDLLANKINQLPNLSDHIVIRILPIVQGGIVVNNYDFHVTEKQVGVGVGEDMKLILWRKSQFNHLNRFKGEMSDEDIADTLLDEFDCMFSFTERYTSYVVFDWITE